VIPIATEVGAERRMYLPLMAFLLLAVLAFDWLAHHLPSVKRRHAPVVGAVVGAGGGAVGGAAVWTVALAVIVGAVATTYGLATRSRNREYQTGLAMARTVLSRWPTSYAHFLLGTELVAVGEHQAAIDELRQAVPSLPRAHYALATQLIATGQLDDAFDHLQAFVREEPWLLEVPAARNQIGRILVRRGELDAAADQFRLVLQMDPTFSEAHRHLADVFAARERFPDAIREYQQYVVDHQQDSDALMGLGVAFQKAGRSAEALAALRQALAADPANAVAARNAAAVELARQNYPGSVAFARQAVQANPNDAGAHDLLGLGLAFQGQLDEAIRQFQRAIQLSPTDVDAQQHLAAVQGARHPTGP
jgi:tetratricopeptide (TPR) repeat protein